MQEIRLADIPTAGWVTAAIVAVLAFILLSGIIAGVFLIVWKKNIRTKFFEVSGEIRPEVREKYIAEGKDLLDNQSQVAKLILKSLRTRLYEQGLQLFNLRGKDKIILDLITYRIIDRVNAEIKDDFRRNHLANKSDPELEKYADAKANAYYNLIRDKLFFHNDKIPQCDLPSILSSIPAGEVRGIFRDIYTSGRAMAG